MRKTSIGCLLHTPSQGPGLPPRHVPWLGIKPVTFCFTVQHSIHWAKPARIFLFEEKHIFPQRESGCILYRWDCCINLKAFFSRPFLSILYMPLLRVKNDHPVYFNSMEFNLKTVWLHPSLLICYCSKPINYRVSWIYLLHVGIWIILATCLSSIYLFAKCPGKYFTWVFTLYCPYTTNEALIIIPRFQLRKPSLLEFRWLVQGHKAYKPQNPYSNPI